MVLAKAVNWAIGIAFQLCGGNRRRTPARTGGQRRIGKTGREMGAGAYRRAPPGSSGRASRAVMFQCLATPGTMARFLLTRILYNAVSKSLSPFRHIKYRRGSDAVFPTT